MPMDSVNISDSILEQLRLQGIDLEALSCATEECKDKVKIVVVAADLKDSLRELCQSPRDKVLMVRVDKDLMSQLDAWVEAGVAKSRSEAGALFLKEGLKVRATELAGLADALKKVEAAKICLREKARQSLGTLRAEEESGG